jgi:hypothetical protein
VKGAVERLFESIQLNHKKSMRNSHDNTIEKRFVFVFFFFFFFHNFFLTVVFGSTATFALVTTESSVCFVLHVALLECSRWVVVGLWHNFEWASSGVD